MLTGEAIGLVTQRVACLLQGCHGGQRGQRQRNSGSIHTVAVVSGRVVIGMLRLAVMPRCSRPPLCADYTPGLAGLWKAVDRRCDGLDGEPEHGMEA
jgi:hypothetical protein